MVQSSSKNARTFKVGQNIMCPSHGVGVVLGIEECGSNNKKFYKLSFEKESLTTFVPVVRAMELGLRHLCSKEVAEKVFDVLAKPFKFGRGMWSRRAQEYDAKIYSGSILLAAEVVRDLFAGSKDQSRSYSERVFFETSMSRVLSELAIVLNISESAIEEKVTAILSKTLGAIPVAKDSVVEDGFEDSDLERFEDGEEDSEEEIAA